MAGLTELQSLLRNLFQSDLADLDFGLYRLLRLKRKEVESFVSERLPRLVGEAFDAATGEQRLVHERALSGAAGASALRDR